MHYSHNDTIDHLSFQLFGLLSKCPFGKEKGDCPLKQLRKECGLENKFSCASRFNSDELVEIMSQHTNCYAERAKRIGMPGYRGRQQGLFF